MSESIWMNSEEVVEEFKIKKSKLYKLTHRREIPHHKLDGRLKFNRDELMGWFDALRVVPVVVEGR